MAFPDSFRPSTTLVRVLLLALAIGAVCDLVAVLSSYSQYDLLRQLQSGVEVSEDAINASDSRQTIMGVIQLVIYVATAIVFCIWTHRVISQAYRVNPSRLTVSPGWGVGFYFIPIANFWKPYQALRDAFVALCDIGRSARGRALFPLWWFAWIVSNILGQVVFRLSMRAEEIDEYVLMALVTIISDGFDVALDVIAFLLVREVSDAYQRSAQPPLLGTDVPVTGRDALPFRASV